MSRKLCFAMILAVSTAQAAAAGSDPADSLAALRHKLNECVRMPAVGEGSEITIQFALKRDGSLLGKPKITHSHLVGDADTQAKFVDAAISAVATCLPLRVTDGLGGAIAGRPFSIRIVSRGRTTGI